MPTTTDPTVTEPADWSTLPPPPPPPTDHPDGRPPRPPRRRRPSRVLLVLGLLFAAATLLWACWQVLDLMAWETSTRTTRYGTVERIELDADCGGVRIVGDRESGTTVWREVRSGLLRPSATESVQDGVLRLEANCAPISSFGNVRYEVHVPPGVSVSGGADGGLHLLDLRGPADIDNGDGSIEVVGGRGTLRLHTGDRAISVSDSTGDLDLQTGDGSISVDSTTSDTIVARTGDGSVHLDLPNAPDRIEAHTGDGSIEITLPADAPAYAVTTDTGDGSVSSSLRTDPSSSRTITADTGDGSIRLRLREND